MSNWFTRIFAGRSEVKASKPKKQGQSWIIEKSKRYTLDQQNKTLTIKQEANIKITKSAVGNKFLINGTIGGVEINETIVLSGKQKLQITGSSEQDQIEISDRASESISKLDPGAGNDIVKVTYNPEMEIDFSQGENTLITRTGTTRADRYESSSPMKVIVPDLDSQTFLDDSGEKATNLGSRKLESSTLFDPNRDPNIPNIPGSQATKNIAKIDVVNTDNEKIAKLEYGTAIRESQTKFFGFTCRTRDRGLFFTEIPAAGSSATEISSTSSLEEPIVIAVPDSVPETSTANVQQENPETDATQTQTTSTPSTPEETVSTPVKDTGAPSVASTAATTTEATDSTEETVLKNTQQPDQPEKIGFELVKRGNQKVFVVKFKEETRSQWARPTISQSQDGTVRIKDPQGKKLGTFGTDGIDLIEIDLSSKESSSSDRNIANDFVSFENMRSNFIVKLGSGFDTVALAFPRKGDEPTNQQIHLISNSSRRLDLHARLESGTAMPEIYIEGTQNLVPTISPSLWYSPEEDLIIHIKETGSNDFTSYRAAKDANEHFYKLEELDPATN